MQVRQIVDTKGELSSPKCEINSFCNHRAMNPKQMIGRSTLKKEEKEKTPNKEARERQRERERETERQRERESMFWLCIPHSTFQKQ